MEAECREEDDREGVAEDAFDDVSSGMLVCFDPGLLGANSSISREGCG